MHIIYKYITSTSYHNTAFCELELLWKFVGVALCALAW